MLKRSRKANLRRRAEVRVSARRMYPMQTARSVPEQGSVGWAKVLGIHMCRLGRRLFERM
jgi:hypothetical protein